MDIAFWFRKLLARVELGTSGYLVENGWLDSRASRVAVDSAGHPVPWFTYPALAFIAPRVRRPWKVLEFGAGAGTEWWSGRVESVTAVEHHAGWADRVSRRCNALVLKTRDDSAEAYTSVIGDRGPFQVVIVDGLFRPECLDLSASLVSPDGVIILDDSQREEYSEAVSGLEAAGFSRLDFHGPQPVSKHAGCTTFLYRAGNVFGI